MTKRVSPSQKELLKWVVLDRNTEEVLLNWIAEGHDTPLPPVVEFQEPRDIEVIYVCGCAACGTYYCRHCAKSEALGGARCACNVLALAVERGVCVNSEEDKVRVLYL